MYNLSVTQLLVVCIDGNMNESIMNHDGTQKYFIKKLYAFLIAII
jgi:hypothetical protein